MRWPLLLVFSVLGGAFLGYASVRRPASKIIADASRFGKVGPRGADHAALTTESHHSDRVAAIRVALAFSKDEFRCEHDLYLALEGATAADFAALTREPDGPLAGGKNRRDSLYDMREALVEGMIERWLAVDDAGALAWFCGGDADFGDGSNFRTIAARTLVRLRPEAVFERIAALPDGGPRTKLLNIFMRGVAESDADRLEQRIARFPEGAMRDAAETAGRQALARANPLAAVERITEQTKPDVADEVWSNAIFGAADSVKTLRALLAKTDDSSRRLEIAENLKVGDPDEAMQIFAEIAARPDATRTGPLARPDSAGWFCKTLAARDPLKTAEWADSLPGGLRTGALAAVAECWSASDPAAAMTWLAAHPVTEPIETGYNPPKRVTDLRAEALGAWLNRDESAARAWIDSQPPDGSTAAFTSQLVSHLMTTERSAEAAAMFVRMDISQQAPLAGQIAGKWATTDPENAATWAVHLPEGGAQQAAIAGAVRGWAEREPAAVAAWIEDFPPGMPRDRAIGSFAQTIAGKDPSAAAEWVVQIADPWRRSLSAETVFWNWHNQDRDAAVAWIRALPEMNETIRQQLLEESQRR